MNRLSALGIYTCLWACVACDRPSRAATDSESKSEDTAPASSRPDASPPNPPCNPAPPDRGSLVIDDFDANDGRPRRSAGRIAYWWSAGDGTGGTLHPEPAEADAMNRPREGKALHFVARNFKKWGALVGINFFWSDGAMRCPLNVAGYAGFKFRAKGSGSLSAQLLTRDTASLSSGGRCEKRCFDHYQRVLQIAPEWTTHAIRWEELRQQGFGERVPLDLKHAVGLTFHAQLADLPVDVWIDDLEFIARAHSLERAP